MLGSALKSCRHVMQAMPVLHDAQILVALQQKLI
jgi:hypothetical protein